VGTVEFSIDHGDTVRTAATDGGKPRGVWTAEEFITYLSKQYAAFPRMQFHYSTEFNGKRLPEGDYYITIVRHSKARGQVFIVQKGN
jgi:hypothetical protein